MVSLLIGRSGEDPTRNMATSEEMVQVIKRFPFDDRKKYNEKAEPWAPLELSRACLAYLDSSDHLFTLLWLFPLITHCTLI